MSEKGYKRVKSVGAVRASEDTGEEVFDLDRFRPRFCLRFRARSYNVSTFYPHRIQIEHENEPYCIHIEDEIEHHDNVQNLGMTGLCDLPEGNNLVL